MWLDVFEELQKTNPPCAHCRQPFNDHSADKAWFAREGMIPSYGGGLGHWSYEVYCSEGGWQHYFKALAESER